MEKFHVWFEKAETVLLFCIVQTNSFPQAARPRARALALVSKPDELSNQTHQILDTKCTFRTFKKSNLTLERAKYVGYIDNSLGFETQPFTYTHIQIANALYRLPLILNEHKTQQYGI